MEVGRLKESAQWVATWVGVAAIPPSVCVLIFTQTDWAIPVKSGAAVLVLVAAVLGKVLLGGAPQSLTRRGDVARFEQLLHGKVAAASYSQLDRLIPAGHPQLRLAMAPRVGAVRDPSVRLPSFPSGIPLSSIEVAYEGASRRLLLLGEPGSGKTLASYQLIEHLHQASMAVVLVNLSSWTRRESSLEDFLQRQLCSQESYGLPHASGLPQAAGERLARNWLATSEFCLVLDGLDEMGLPTDRGLKQDLLTLLRDFLVDRPWVGILLTCRSADWRDIRSVAPMVGSVEMLPLGDGQIDGVLATLAVRDQSWMDLAGSDVGGWRRDVRSALASPLVSALVVEAQLRLDEVMSNGASGARAAIVEGYISSRLRSGSRYPAVDARQWLGWIARFLNGTEMAWRGTRSTDRAVFGAASFCPMRPTWRDRLPPGLILGLLLARLDLTAGGLSGAIVLGTFTFVVFTFVMEGDARPAEKVRKVDFDRVRKSMWGSMKVAFLAGLLPGTLFLILGWQARRPIPGVYSALVAQVSLTILGGMYGAVVALKGSTARQVSATGDLLSARRSSLRSFFGKAVYGIVLGVLLLSRNWQVGLLIGAFGGALVGMEYGGWFFVLQGRSNAELRRRRAIPPHLDRFVTEMTTLGLLRPTGGGYRFRHDLIQRGCASPPPMRSSAPP